MNNRIFSIAKSWEWPGVESSFKLIMGERIVVSLVLLFNSLLFAVAQTANYDFMVLKSLRDSWQNTPSSWESSDPCNDHWDGIKCINSSVTSISIPGTGLAGQLSTDIGSLSELETLDLSYNRGLTGPLPQEIGNLKKLSNLNLVGCGFTGPIPDEIGSLQQLVVLSLNSNSLVGRIPPSIGKLSKINWLDLADNQLDGPIPVSSGTTPGLDMLLSAKHFHLGKNKLSGEIPSQLFSSKMTLIHVIFESNQLIGSIPDTLGLVQSLEVVRFENNALGGNVPRNLNNLINVTDLLLFNNKLQGPLPNLTGMSSLTYLDLSNNSFDQSEFPPWLLTLKSLTTLGMVNVNLYGNIPVPLFSLASLQNVILKSNKLDGTLDIGTNYSKKLKLIDLRKNSIENFKQQNELLSITIMLAYNPICEETGATGSYCTMHDVPDTKPQNNCLPVICSSYQTLSPNCKCARPYTGTLTFRAPSWFQWRNKASLEEDLMHDFQSRQLPVDSVSLSIPTDNPFQCFQYTIQIFPSGQDHFNQKDISSISLFFSNLSAYEPFDFTTDMPGPKESSNSSNTVIIIGAAVGGSVLLVLSLLAGVYAFRQKRRAERAISKSNPFGDWDPNKSSCGIPQLKAARQFSFKELMKYTNNFSQGNDIGSGGYGKVYQGTLPDGQLIAIKRAQNESKQGGLEFKAEIELLSRVHHKNLVSLVGFCFEQDEQMLVYEFVPNGTLKDSISGKSGIVLGWSRRLKVALGAARGLAYLHEHADPPIIHRDIKSSNILLDKDFNAKVADFGLSKPMLDSEKDHVTTQVKGTMGYMDPDYYTSHQLTEKSDVYSFGVLMLELITARKPIERGKYIVKVVRNAIDKTKDLYGLHEILDPAIGSGSTLKGFVKFVDLAMKCVEESGADRPTMSDVVKEIEDMLQSAGLDPTAESTASTSSSFRYHEVSIGISPHPNSNESFDSSAEHLHPRA